MPQFILSLGSDEAARSFKHLDSFTQGYITAALWTEEESLTEDGAEEVSFGVIAAQTQHQMRLDCQAFQAARSVDLDKAEEEYGRDREHLGHDFWLTRNGHGTGFWDRDMGAVGDSLDRHARTFRQVDLYVGDDGLIYAA